MSKGQSSRVSASGEPSVPLSVVKAELFKALANPARVRALELLADGERSVGDMQPLVGIELSHLSQQLAVLRKAGLVAALFGGSNVQVSGPTGAMTVVLVPLVARYGAHGVFLAGLMAGVLIVIASFARVGRALRYVPWPVVEGFTVGIAVLIALQQV